MIIRPCEPRDYPALIALWRACGLTRPQNDPLKDIERKLSVGGQWLLVGELNGRIVAGVMAGYDGHRGHINYLGVDPTLRGRGLGRQLLDYVEELFDQAGCPKINLQIRAENTAVIEFYRRCGYRLSDTIAMDKRLSSDET